MNVIFLDFDGVLDTYYYKTDEDIENKVAILADICKSLNCKVVIEASAKIAIDENTLEVNPDSKWVEFLFDLFKKYNIEVIGRTPEVRKYNDNQRTSYISMWKEDEIRLYLYKHPEIKHYCVIDDDDLTDLHRKSDLDKVRNHLIKTNYYNKDNPLEEGILSKHKQEVKQILRKDNEIRKMVLKRKKYL